MNGIQDGSCAVCLTEGFCIRAGVHRPLKSSSDQQNPPNLYLHQVAAGRLPFAHRCDYSSACKLAHQSDGGGEQHRSRSWAQVTVHIKSDSCPLVSPNYCIKRCSDTKACFWTIETKVDCMKMPYIIVRGIAYHIKLNSTTKWSWLCVENKNVCKKRELYTHSVMMIWKFKLSGTSAIILKL